MKTFIQKSKSFAKNICTNLLESFSILKIVKNRKAELNTSHTLVKVKHFFKRNDSIMSLPLCSLSPTAGELEGRRPQVQPLSGISGLWPDVMKP